MPCYLSLLSNPLLCSPLLEQIISLPPRDLWPNAEMFMKQIKGG